MRLTLLILLSILAGPTVLATAQDPTAGFDLGGLAGGFNTGGFDNGGAGGGTTSNDNGAIQPVELELGGNQADTRNQGFVGATSVEIQELGFVGAASETLGPALSDGSFGGGINNSGTQAGGGGGGGGGGNPFRNGGFNGGFGGQNQLGTGTENGFEVIRQSVRARLVPRIDARPVSSEQTVSRFQNRFSRQPAPQVTNQAVRGFNASAVQSGSVNIQVENRTAVLTGFANSNAERQHLERQLRLEPGIDRIINQIEIPSPLANPIR